MLRLPENTVSIHTFVNSLSFPVFIYSTNEWEEAQISYLYRNYIKEKFTTYTICKWCESHNISCQIFFPHSKLQLIKLIKKPSRILCYIYLKQKGIQHQN